MKKIKGLMGYTISEVIVEEMEVLAEIMTGGTSGSGYKGEETLGIVLTQRGNLGIYRGGVNETHWGDSSTVVRISDTGQSISKSLRELADAYDAT